MSNSMVGTCAEFMAVCATDGVILTTDKVNCLCGKAIASTSLINGQLNAFISLITTISCNFIPLVKYLCDTRPDIICIHFKHTKRPNAGVSRATTCAYISIRSFPFGPCSSFPFFELFCCFFSLRAPSSRCPPSSTLLTRSLTSRQFSSLSARTRCAATKESMANNIIQCRCDIYRTARPQRYNTKIA